MARYETRKTDRHFLLTFVQGYERHKGFTETNGYSTTSIAH